MTFNKKKKDLFDPQMRLDIYYHYRSASTEELWEGNRALHTWIQLRVIIIKMKGSSRFFIYSGY